MSEPLTPRKRIQLHFDVATDDQAQELSAAWEEIVSRLTCPECQAVVLHPDDATV